MARLSAAARKKIPTSQFGVPSKAKSPAGKAKSGSYPMPDRSHASFAIAMAHKNHPPEEAAIVAKARRILGGKGKGK